MFGKSSSDHWKQSIFKDSIHISGFATYCLCAFHSPANNVVIFVQVLNAQIIGYGLHGVV